MGEPEPDLAYLALASVPGIGPRRICSLIDGFGNAESVLSAGFARLLRVPGISRAAATAIGNASITDVEKNVMLVRGSIPGARNGIVRIEKQSN